MNYFFTPLRKLIAVVLPIKKVTTDYFPTNNWGGANDDLALPGTTEKPQGQRELRFSIFSLFQMNLAPVAIRKNENTRENFFRSKLR